MIRTLHFCFIFFCFGLSLLSAQEIVKNKVVVKLRSNYAETEAWFKNNRTGTLPSLNELLGSHTTVPYVRDAIISAIEQKKRLNSSIINVPNKSPLSRIAIIEYDKAIDPITMSVKLKSYPFVEYAEPLYERQLLLSTNDSLFNEQYWIQNVKALEAVEIMPPNSSVVIAITDTGVDYTHPDLEQNVWTNPGESGKDNSGNDKRTNGIDDDKNGFVDDWRGWDFVSSTNNNGDNDPSPGHEHGTHVAGIAGAIQNNGIGIAGTNKYAKILPVKIGPDQPSLSVSYGHEAILYAAATGANVINCSWGSQGYQEAEYEAVKEAISLGATVVAAAGNSGIYGAYYPAAYPEVLSIASVKMDDSRSSFSNFHNSVDVSAPGQNIISTVPGKEYDYNSGTSMAAPCAAAIVGMAKIMYPDYSPEQLTEHVKATADNIDTLNKEYIGLLGTGRVNAYRVVHDKQVRAVRLLPVPVIEETNDGIYEPGEKLTFDITIKNVLAPLVNAHVSVQSPRDFVITIANSEYNIGKLGSLEEKSLSTPCSFTVPANCPLDYKAVFPVVVTDTGNFQRIEYFSLLLNPTFRTIDGNAIKVTLNSRGNLCYNDYPYNTQGIGFRWNNGSNLCYEAGLIVGSSYDSISNVVRSAQTDYQNKDFTPVSIITLNKPGSISALDAKARFTDLTSTTRAGLDIDQSTYQFNTESAKNILFLNYKITNNTSQKLDSVYLALYFDWDIGPGGANNFVGFDNQEGFGLCYNVEIDTLPAIGVQLTSPHTLNYTAIDNEASIYNGFTLREKWNAISRGVWYRESPIGDVSMVIGAGNIQLQPMGTTEIGFAIGVAPKVNDLKSVMKQAQTIAKEKNIAKGFVWEALPSYSSITDLYPNPTNGKEVTLTLDVTARHQIILELYDVLGRLQETLLNEALNAGTYTKTFQVNGYSSGCYFIRLKQNGGENIIPLQID